MADGPTLPGMAKWEMYLGPVGDVSLCMYTIELACSVVALYPLNQFQSVG